MVADRGLISNSKRLNWIEYSNRNKKKKISKGNACFPVRTVFSDSVGTFAWFGRPSVSCPSFSSAWCPTDWVKAAATFCMIGVYGGQG